MKEYLSDHRIVTAKIRLNLNRNKKQTDKTTHYDWLSPTDKDISYEYTVTIRNKFVTLQEISETHTPNEECKNFITAHMEVLNIDWKTSFTGRGNRVSGITGNRPVY